MLKVNLFDHEELSSSFFEKAIQKLMQFDLKKKHKNEREINYIS